VYYFASFYVRQTVSSCSFAPSLLSATPLDLRELELIWEDLAAAAAAENRQRWGQRLTQGITDVR